MFAHGLGLVQKKLLNISFIKSYSQSRSMLSTVWYPPPRGREGERKPEGISGGGGGVVGTVMLTAKNIAHAQYKKTDRECDLLFIVLRG